MMIACNCAMHVPLTQHDGYWELAAHGCPADNVRFTQKQVHDLVYSHKPLPIHEAILIKNHPRITDEQLAYYTKKARYEVDIKGGGTVTVLADDWLKVADELRELRAYLAAKRQVAYQMALEDEKNVRVSMGAMMPVGECTACKRDPTSKRHHPADDVDGSYLFHNPSKNTGITPPRDELFKDLPKVKVIDNVTFTGVSITERGFEMDGFIPHRDPNMRQVGNYEVETYKSPLVGPAIDVIANEPVNTLLLGDADDYHARLAAAMHVPSHLIVLDRPAPTPMVEDPLPTDWTNLGQAPLHEPVIVKDPLNPHLYRCEDCKPNLGCYNGDCRCLRLPEES